jgi:hypothetical protein
MAESICDFLVNDTIPTSWLIGAVAGSIQIFATQYKNFSPVKIFTVLGLVPVVVVFSSGKIAKYYIRQKDRSAINTGLLLEALSVAVTQNYIRGYLLVPSLFYSGRWLNDRFGSYIDAKISKK